MANLIERALGIKIHSTVCISLEEDQERRKQTEAECRAVGLPVQFHVVKKHPSSGVQGCLESHIQIIQYAKQNDFENILILEDDIQFDIETIKSTNIQIPTDYQMIYLGYHVNKGYRYQDNLLKLLSALTTHSYILHQNSYDYILENINKDWTSIPEYYDQNQHEKPFFALNNRSIDIFYSKWLHQRNDKTYGVYPLFAYQRPAYSHIEKQNVDYTQLFKAKAQYYYDRFIGHFKGVYHLGPNSEYNNLEHLCRELKKTDYNRWDFVLIADSSNLLHERTPKQFDTYQSTICNEDSWDILSLTETYQQPFAKNLLMHPEREEICNDHKEVIPMIFNNHNKGTKALYEFLTDKPKYARLRKQLSKMHIYYMRMTYVEKLLDLRDSDLIKEHYQFPPIDDYTFSNYHKHCDMQKEILCIYLAKDITFNSIKDKLGILDTFDVYVCGPKEDINNVTFITRRDMAALPQHRLIIVNDIMFFADQPLHADDVTLLVTQSTLTQDWKGLHLPFEGRSVLYNFIDKITRLVFLTKTDHDAFMNLYELESSKQTCFILDYHDLDVNTSNRNIMICVARGTHDKDVNLLKVREYVEFYKQIKKKVPNMKLYINRSDKSMKKLYKKDKDIFVNTSRQITWNGDILLEYDDTELFKEAIPKGIICVGRNKDYCHVVLDDQNTSTMQVISKFSSLLMNPIQKRTVSENIKNTFEGVTYRNTLFQPNI